MTRRSSAGRMPSINFFSGFHADYHRPSDDWDKNDVPGATEVTRIALSLVERIAARAERPTFVEPAVPPRQTPSGDGGAGSRGSRALLRNPCLTLATSTRA